MRLIYFGSGEFGTPTLRRLARDHQVLLAVTQPDRPAGRTRALTATPIAEMCVELGIPVIKPIKVNEPSVVGRIRGLDADAFVVIAFGQKLGRALLDGVFAVNLHGSLLPKYRGAAPINWAMINGERQTGISVITLADRMDAGLILSQRSTPIDPLETAGELHDRLSLLGPDAVAEVLRDHEQGDLKAVAQDEREVTQAPKFTKADGTVRFDQPATAVRQRVHGLTPWPGCAVKLGEASLRLLRVQEIDGDTARSPGTILEDQSVACEKGRLRLLEVQPPGGRPMSFEAYLRGHGVSLGARCMPA